VFPILIDVGRFDFPLFGETHLFLPSYGVLFAVAVLVAWSWFMRRTRAMGLPEDQLFNQTFYSLLGGIFGAKALLILVDLPYYLEHPAAILGTLRSAGVLLGGIVVGGIVYTLYGRKHDLPLLRLLDAIAAPVALAQAIGRLGCFCAGCCWGLPAAADNPFAVTFTHQAASTARAFLGVPLVPTQLIQLVHDLLLSGLLTWMWRRDRLPRGSVFWLYIMIYSVGRSVIEMWRGDVSRGLYFNELLSTSQLVSIVGFVLAASMLVRGFLRRR